MKSILLLFALSIIAVTTLSTFGQKSKPFSEKDLKVYDRIEQVKGKVTILNHPDLGKTPGSGMYLVFQREGCEDCLVGTHADIDGNYKVFIGIGKYKLIVQEKNCGYAPSEDCEGHNLLAADQEQTLVVVKGRPYTAEFNINLVLPR